MKKIFSTDTIRPAERFEYWVESARKYICDHDARADNPLTFEASLHCAAIEELAVMRVEGAPSSAARTARHAARTPDDELFVFRQLTGALSIEQNYRSAVLAGGDFALVDPRLPYTARFSEHSSMLIIKFPRRRLEARVGRTGNMVGRLMKSAEFENGLVSDFLALLPIHAEQISTSAGIVANQTLDLLAVALTKATDVREPNLSSARLVVLARLRAVIERRLNDHALSAAAAAAAAGVSVRYANAVLADTNTSLMQLIQTRRLDRCRQALADPMQLHRSISDIAYCWGFSDMTHFGRRFRAAYGLLPSEFRRKCSLELA